MYMRIVRSILHPIDIETIPRISFVAIFVIFYFIVSL